MDDIIFIAVTLLVIGITLVILKLLGFPLYSDPFGLKSKRLSNRNGETVKFRHQAIDKALDKGIFNVMMVAGEFGSGIRKATQYSLEKGLSVTIVGGQVNNLEPEARKALTDLMIHYPGKLQYYQLPERPIYHFSIFGQDLFIEDPHGPKEQIKGSMGIIEAYPEYLSKFSTTFSSMKESAVPYELNTA